MAKPSKPDPQSAEALLRDAFRRIEAQPTPEALADQVKAVSGAPAGRKKQ